ncbi:MAG: NrpR regulatory domain-containing protein [Lentisphaerae bacterium]|nr:NrpR regulatory domain-containing protein [Lentisphaerota bacterium]
MRKPQVELDRAILTALAEARRPTGATHLADALAIAGIPYSSRAVRLRLAALDRSGLTRLVTRRAGRELTERGRDELSRGDAIGKLGSVAARIDTLVCQMSGEAGLGTGTIVTNRARIPGARVARALEDMKAVFARRLSMGQLLSLQADARGAGEVTIATVCSITVNGILMRQGVPVTSRFGGLLEYRDGRPLRFAELIEYEGTTLDPLEIFIQAGMTRVRDCARTGAGLIGASFREFPANAGDRVDRARVAMERAGLGGILLIGRPGQPLLGVPVASGRTGMIVAAGLNPIAALREGGHEVVVQSLAGLADYASLSAFELLRNRWPR